jgi:uncharacterized OsmC-like protein
MPNKARVRLFAADGYRTTVQSRNHIYHADEPEEAGGKDEYATPAELAMGALGSCIAITVKLYADRKKWPLEGIEIDLDFERFNAKDYAASASDEGFVHEIRKSIKLHGALDAEQRERLLDIAGKCPVHRLIATPSFFVETVLKEEESFPG